jgi:hypothetical protein
MRGLVVVVVVHRRLERRQLQALPPMGALAFHHRLLGRPLLAVAVAVAEWTSVPVRQTAVQAEPEVVAPHRTQAMSEALEQ